ALLFLFALLAVGFGLAVSSGASTPSAALLITLPLSVSASMFTYFGLGMGLSLVGHELWPGISQGTPVWLPSAYVRAGFGRVYLVYLLLRAAGSPAILAGFFTEITVSNLRDPSDDRATGTKKWFVAASAGVVLLGTAASFRPATSRWIVLLVALAV